MHVKALNSPHNIRCVGYFSPKDNPNRRLAKPLVYYRTPSQCSSDNGYSRPIEGLHIVVDMQHMEVIEFEDRDFVPIPPPDPLRNYTEGEDRGGKDREDIKPLHIVQPQGPSFTVTGSLVNWQRVSQNQNFWRRA